MDVLSPAYLAVFLPLCAAACLLIKNARAKAFILTIASAAFLCFFDAWALLFYSVCIWAAYFMSKYHQNNAGALLFALVFVILRFTAFYPVGYPYFLLCLIAFLLSRQDVSLFSLFSYSLFFPKLLSGPVTMDAQGFLRSARHTEINALYEGMRRFCKGLVKKVLLAENLAVISDAAFQSPQTHFLFSWLGVIVCALQLYYDFSGYTDMALGAAQMLGFTLPENFDRPFSALSLRDFWRRWHMSLSRFFSRFVYIPLGGDRKGKFALCRNLLVVFLLTGLWHGFTWNYLLWGLMHALALTAERMNLLHPQTWKKPLSHLYVFFFVALSFVFFKTNTPAQALSFFTSLFTAHESLNPFLYQLSPVHLIVLFMSMLFIITPRRPKNGLYDALLLLSTALCVLSLASGTFHPFLYAQF